MCLDQLLLSLVCDIKLIPYLVLIRDRALAQTRLGRPGSGALDSSPPPFGPRMPLQLGHPKGTASPTPGSPKSPSPKNVLGELRWAAGTRN